MTPEQEAAIRKAARAHAEAQMIVQSMELRNMPEKTEDRLLLAEEYALARARLGEADRALRRALELLP